jgi:parvulin-like peptidyl-prolyl isomerase
MVLSLRRRTIWPLLAAAALAATSCHPRITDPQDPNFIVAQGDGWTITRAQLDHEADEYFKEHQITPAQVGPANMPALETALLRRMALEQVLVARAEKKDLKDVDKADADALDRLKGRFPSEQAFQDRLKQTGMTEDELKKQINEQVLIEKLFEAEALHDVDPTDKEVNDFYLGHKSIFEMPLKLRASRVIVLVDENATPAQKAEKKKIIEAAHARVAKGEPFSKVAMEVSDDRYTAPRGGDTGYFQRGENEGQFDEVAFSSKLGELSPVFETPAGYNFLEVTEIKPAGLMTIDDARQPIIENLRKIKIAQEEQAYAENTLKDAKVTYNIPLTELPPDATNGPPADTSAPPPSDSATTTNAAPGGP